MFKLSKLQKITVTAMLVFGVGVFLWFNFGGSGSSSKSAVTKSLMNAKKICVACRVYAADHAGDFPPSLDALFPTYLQDRTMLASPLNPSEAEGYIYTPGLKSMGPVNAVVIEDKYAPLQHIRIVAYVDDSARVLTGP